MYNYIDGVLFESLCNFSFNMYKYNVPPITNTIETICLKYETLMKND